MKDVLHKKNSALLATKGNSFFYILWGIYRGVLVAVIFSILFGIGFWGFASSHQPANFLDAAYRTLQLLVLEASFENFLPLNWQLEFARFALPLFTAATLVAVILKVAGQQLLLFRLSLFPKKIILLGGGRTASGIAANLANAGATLIAVDIDSDQRHAQSICRRAGASVLNGDATNTATLRHLNLWQASEIFIFTGDDLRDLDIAKRVISLLSMKHGDKPRLIIDIDDKALLAVASNDPAFAAYRTQMKGEVIWFSTKAQLARMLFHKHPPIDCSSRVYQKSVHIGIVGLGVLAQEIVLQAIRSCVYLDDHPLLISVFSDDEEAYDQFIDRYPVLREGQCDPAYGGVLPLVDIRLYRYQIDAPSPAVIRHALAERDQISFAKFYITEQSDYACLHAGLRILQTTASLGLNQDVICCLPGSHFADREEAEAMQLGSGTAEGLHLFHAISDLCHSGEEYPGSRADEIGMMIDAAYSAIFRGRLPSESPSELRVRFERNYKEDLADAQASWKKLPDFRRWSSRHAGDHLYVKIRELGFMFEKAEPETSTDIDNVKVFSLLENAIERTLPDMKRLEHRRFCAERFIDGWLYSPVKNRELLLNETLVPFDQLAPEEYDKDEAIIRALPVIIKVSPCFRDSCLVPLLRM